MSESYIPINDIAHTLGMDKSRARRYILENGFSFVRIRTRDSKGQLTLALSPEDTEEVIRLRRSQGFNLAAQVAVIIDRGAFYIIQPVPDLDPRRVKLGFATNVQQRLNSYRTLSPTAALLKQWACRVAWEKTAIDSITRSGCIGIGGEVYTCDDIDEVVAHGDAFFALMPPA
jgi:hypothetical protein